MIAACPESFRYTDEDGNEQWRTKGDGFDIKVHGAWVVSNAVLSNDDPPQVITPPVWDDRFHLDVVCTDEIAAQISDSIKVYPDTPGHTFQGIDG